MPGGEATPAPDPGFVALLTALGVQGHAGALCAAHVRCEVDLRLLGKEDCKELGFSIGERNRVAHWAGTADDDADGPWLAPLHSAPPRDPRAQAACARFAHTRAPPSQATGKPPT